LQEKIKLDWPAEPTSVRATAKSPGRSFAFQPGHLTWRDLSYNSSHSSSGTRRLSRKH